MCFMIPQSTSLLLDEMYFQRFGLDVSVAVQIKVLHFETDSVSTVLVQAE